MKAPGVPALSLGNDVSNVCFGSRLIGARGQTVERPGTLALRAADSTNCVYIEPPPPHLTEEK